jgi:hypothetical protein
MGRNPGHVAGEQAEFAVAADLVRENCRVSYTHGEYKYDLIADKDDCLLRVQVKKANQDPDREWVYRIFTDGYDEGDLDIFAGYVPDPVDEVFYVTYGEAGTEVRINTKSGDDMTEHNRDTANLIDEYGFDRVYEQIKEQCAPANK